VCIMTRAYDPHGAALLDCFRGKSDAMLICYQDGKRDDVPASFWLREQIDPLETLGLDLCKGRVLDVGAGAGLHTLELQRRGFDVTAIDISADCVSIMRERGVKRAEVADLFAFRDEPFDTIINLCNCLDKVGTLANLPRFLERMRSLLSPGGQIIADSFDVRMNATEAQLAEQKKKTDSGRYFGELDLRFEYNGQRGEPFSVLQIDYDCLAQVAERHGWTCEVVKNSGGHYLMRARLAED
jgi:SAM-dependent methyltransferase